MIRDAAERGLRIGIAYRLHARERGELEQFVEEWTELTDQ